MNAWDNFLFLLSLTVLVPLAVLFLNLLYTHLVQWMTKSTNVLTLTKSTGMAEQTTGRPTEAIRVPSLSR
jgi:hypothetical protein